MGPVPFQHGEFDLVGIAELPVSEDAAYLEDLIPTPGQKFLHVILGRSVQVHFFPGPIGTGDKDLQGRQVRLHAGRRDQTGSLDFNEPFLQEILPDPLDDFSPPKKAISTILVHLPFFHPR